MNSSNLAIRLKAVSDTINRVVRDKLKVGAVEAPKYLNHVRDEIIVKRVSEANNWYTRVLGLDVVKFQQDRVLTLQEKLLDVQEKRREIGHRLMDIRRKSNELQEELHKVKRQDDLQRFLDLMKAETQTLKQEMEVSNQFNAYDREEREIFTAYTNAVKDSHEKQRAQLEYTKYFGIILSILGSFFTFCYSTFRKRDLKNYIDERLNINVDGNTTPVLMQLHANQKEIQALYNYVANDRDLRGSILNNQKELLTLLDKSDVLNALHKNHRELMRSLKTIVVDKTVPPVQEEQEPSLQQTFLLLGSVALCGYIFLKGIIG